MGALNALTSHTSWSINFKESLIGGAALDATDNKDAFPDSSLEECRKADSILLACIGGYKWDNNPREARPETGLLKMRSEVRRRRGGEGRGGEERIVAKIVATD